MEVTKAIESRSSCRVFLDRPVEQSLLEEVCALACKAPSALNLQPWLFTGVMGPELARLSRRLIKAWGERGISCAPDAAAPLPQRYADRQKDLNQTMGPAVKATSSPWKDLINEGSLNFYGAPAVLICSGEAAPGPAGRVRPGPGRGLAAPGLSGERPGHLPHRAPEPLTRSLSRRPSTCPRKGPWCWAWPSDTPTPRPR